MLEYAFAGFESQIQAVERGIALLQHVDHAQRLQIVLEAAVRFHAGVQRILPGVAERRVAEVMRQRDGFDQVFVEPQVARDRAADLRNLEAVRKPRAKQVAFVIDEYLGLVFEPAERGGMNDAVAVALKFAAPARRGFAITRGRANCAGWRHKARVQASRGALAARAPASAIVAARRR